MTARPFIALGSTALAAMALGAAYLLLNSCGVHYILPFGFQNACPEIRYMTTRSGRMDEALTRRKTLEMRIAGLERALGAVECVPSRHEHAAGPDIREEDWKNQDVGLLEGCWSLDSDYSIQDEDTGVLASVASWRMCFDDMGSGSQTLIFENGSVCESNQVRAEFNQNGDLAIFDNEDVECSNRYRIYARDTTCVLVQDGSASCVSRQKETGGGSNVRLRR